MNMSEMPAMVGDATPAVTEPQTCQHQFFLKHSQFSTTMASASAASKFGRHWETYNGHDARNDKDADPSYLLGGQRIV